MLDMNNGALKGIGFVTMNDASALAVIDKLNQSNLKERVIKVTKAQEQK